jgi:hypothetical protein
MVLIVPTAPWGCKPPTRLKRSRAGTVGPSVLDAEQVRTDTESFKRALRAALR